MPPADSPFRRWAEGILDFVFPRRCPLCDQSADQAPCESCVATFEPVDSAPTLPDIDDIVTVFRYEGRCAQAVRRLKYDRVTRLAPWLGEQICIGVDRAGLDYDTVVPVPIHRSRRFERGFNQSDLLAEAFPSHLVRPDLLVRKRRTLPQVRVRPEFRSRNVAGAFWAKPEAIDRSILLIDDVLTTGHTVQECARALRAAGARRILVGTVASGAP